MVNDLMMGNLLAPFRDKLFSNLKNLVGWKTKRRIVVFSVDDYGNVWNDSRAARDRMNAAGLNIRTRFDASDAMETTADLEILFKTLRKVKDQHGRSPVFTVYVPPCNIDFDKMADQHWDDYYAELLPVTFEKLAQRQPDAYAGAWARWQEGMEEGLLRPQFHGREHFNLPVFLEKLEERDMELMTALKERSLTTLTNTGHPPIKWTAAFAFREQQEIKMQHKILQEGLDAFEQVFGYRATVFTPPAQQFHADLYPVLVAGGIRAIDRPLVYKQYAGEGKFKRQWEWLRFDPKARLVILVRNVQFEPAKGPVDHVGKALQQIEAAFRLNRPVNISSHRMNFGGHLDPQNRDRSIIALEALLQAVVQRWPDVEFMTTDELADLIAAKP